MPPYVLKITSYLSCKYDCMSIWGFIIAIKTVSLLIIKESNFMYRLYQSWGWAWHRQPTLQYQCKWLWSGGCHHLFFRQVTLAWTCWGSNTHPSSLCNSQMLEEYILSSGSVHHHSRNKDSTAKVCIWTVVFQVSNSSWQVEVNLLLLLLLIFVI